MDREQDDLEYNITFPTPNSDAVGEIEEPVVFLLGWVGASDKHLAKYSKIYEKEGCVTIRYIHPGRDIFFYDPSSNELLKAAARKLDQLLDDYGLRDQPVLIHVLSNGGFFVYYHLAECFLKKHVNVVGTVFDSCPGKVEFLVGSKAIYNSGIIPNKIAAFFAVIAFGILVFVWRFIRLFGFLKNADIYQVKTTSTEETWPHLYLYSTADVIVPHRHIQEMANHRMALASVQTYNFESSPHILHFKHFPDAYSDKCLQFLTTCLGYDN